MDLSSLDRNRSLNVFTQEKLSLVSCGIITLDSLSSLNPGFTLVSRLKCLRKAPVYCTKVLQLVYLTVPTYALVGS